MLRVSLTSRFTPYVARLAAHRWLAVSALSGLSLLIYWLGLIRPYNLFVLMVRPLVDIAKLTRGQPLAQASFVLTFAALSALYYLIWRVCRGGPHARATWAAVLSGAFAVNLALLWLYPIGAADVFDNIARGRITARYGGNPFYDWPRDYRRDFFYRYTAWRTATTAYGPAWELLAAGTSRLAGDDPLANVLAFKALGVLFYGGCLALIARILNRHAPERALQGVALFAWNPLVMYETAGNGHNDIVMAFFILLGVDWLLRRRFTRAALALMVGALIKFIPILLIPVAVMVGLRAQTARRARLWLALKIGLACAALVVAAYAPFWRGGDVLAWERREGLFTTSLPALAQVTLKEWIGSEPSERLVSREALALVGAVALAQMWRVWRRTDWLAPVRAFAAIILFYLLFAVLWFQPWYTVWALAFAAILPEGVMGRTAVLLSYAALWKTIIFDFVLYRGGPLPPRLWRETWLAPATLGLVWLYALYARIRADGQQRLKTSLAPNPQPPTPS
jgi:hypothetical protein